MNPDKQPARPSGPVMDVQRPRTNPAPSEVTTPLDNPMAPADSIASVTPDPGQVIGQQPLQQTAQPVQGKKKRTGLIIAIVTIVLILVIGGGVAGFIIYKNNHKPVPAASDAQSETERVNVQEIDATTAEIDKTLNSLNDSSDVTSNDTSNSTLGL